MTHLGWRVFTCNLCGAQFRYERVGWDNPHGWPPFIYGDVVDPDTDLAHRQHSVVHGGTLDRQNAYCGPTTYTVTKEPHNELATTPLHPEAEARHD